MTQQGPVNGELVTVMSAVAAMHHEPRISSAWTSQLLAGQVARVLDVSGDWLRVRGEDDYEGWIHRGYVRPSSGNETGWDVSLGCRVRTGSMERDLPLLSRIDPTHGVVNGQFVRGSELHERFRPTPTAIAKSALSFFMGASYVWGGVTPWGCDCSGFVQSVYRLHGVMLPRDASPQAKSLGALDTTTPFADLAQATLAFFSDRDDRRITHVGIMLGDALMAHSGLSRGGFAVENMMSMDDDYVAALRRNYVGSASPVLQLS